jgi:hypothetical protein
MNWFSRSTLPKLTKSDDPAIGCSYSEMLEPNKLLHIAVFTPGYGTEGAGAAGLRWHWLGRHLALAGAEVTVFHNMPDRKPRQSELVREVYLPGPAFHADRISYRAFARAGYELKVKAASPRLQKLGHYMASAALRYRQSALESQADSAFEQIHAQQPFNVAIGVCAPWSTAVAAKRVASAWAIPYLIEFQDPWKDFFEHGSWRVHSNTVKGITEQAAALINVCEHWCAQDAFDLNKPSLCVPNGFEPALIDESLPAPASSLRFAYIGTLGYMGAEYISTLWQGLAQIKDLDWALDYVGRDVELVQSAAAQWNLRAHINAVPSLSQAEALRVLKAADSLILFTHPKRDSHFGSKYSEYVACKRPILMVGRPDPFLAEASQPLTRLLACRDAEAVAQTVSSLIQEKRDNGILAWQGDAQAIAQLSWASIASRLLADLKSIVAQASAARIG